jgi:hypothetical protein
MTLRLVTLSPAFFFAYGKIPFARPRSSVDRASASGAEEHGSSPCGGAKIRHHERIFFFNPFVSFFATQLLDKIDLCTI